MPLSEEDKQSIRRHLGYPVAGLPTLSPAGGTLMGGAIGYRFTQAYGQLEYRMNSLQPGEESRLMGRCVAALQVAGTPNIGDTLAVTISGGGLSTPVVLTVTASLGMAQPILPVPTSILLPTGIAQVPDSATSITVPTNANLPYVVVGVVPSWPTTVALTVEANGSFTVTFGTPAPSGGGTLNWQLSALNLSSPIIPSTDNGIRLGLCAALQTLTLLNASLVSAGISARAPYGTGPLPSTGIPMATVSWVGTTIPFQVAITSQSGGIAAGVVASGSLLAPSLQYTQQGVTTTIFGYVPILDFIEGLQGGSVVNMDTNKADVWTARLSEFEQKTAAYYWWCQHMADFLGPELWTQSPAFLARRGGGLRVRI
jgi:hypothetical protein